MRRPMPRQQQQLNDWRSIRLPVNNNIQDKYINPWPDFSLISGRRHLVYLTNVTIAEHGVSSSVAPLRIMRNRDWGCYTSAEKSLVKEENCPTTRLRLVAWAGSAPGQQWSKSLQSRCLLPQRGLLRKEGDTSGLGHLCRDVPRDGPLTWSGSWGLGGLTPMATENKRTEGPSCDSCGVRRIEGLVFTFNQ